MQDCVGPSLGNVNGNVDTDLIVLSSKSCHISLNKFKISNSKSVYSHETLTNI